MKNPRIRLKKYQYSISVEKRNENTRIITGFSVGAYPRLTKLQATKISKILYPNHKMIALHKIFD